MYEGSYTRLTSQIQKITGACGLQVFSYGERMRLPVF